MKWNSALTSDQKQKSDNKFFKIMADQESKDSERKQAVRYVEKQGKQIEALMNIEKDLQSSNVRQPNFSPSLRS